MDDSLPTTQWVVPTHLDEVEANPQRALRRSKRASIARITRSVTGSRKMKFVPCRLSLLHLPKVDLRAPTPPG